MNRILSITIPIIYQFSFFRNQAVINFVLSTPQPVLYKTFTTGTERHTGEYLCEEIVKVMEDIGPEKFIAVVTDNAAAMEKAKSLLQGNNYSFLTVYSCIAHTLNLLVGDIMQLKSLQNIEVSCKEIVKEVTASHLNLAQFNKIQNQNGGKVITLKLPVKTRWGSILHCLKSLWENKNSLQILMVTEGVKFSKNVKKNCLDDEIFWVKVENIIPILDPIVKWITLLEGDTLRISQVALAFKDIENNFKTHVPTLPILKSEEDDCFTNFTKRKRMAVKPLHYAANLLDPNFRGEHLNNDEHVLALEYIHSLIGKHPQFVNKKDQIFSELNMYIAKTEMWALDFIWSAVKDVDCITWWNGMCQKTNLKDLAVAILGLPPSSAATERSFSTYSLIHTKKRNRLTVDRAGVLLYIAHNNKLLRKTGAKGQSSYYRDSNPPDPVSQDGGGPNIQSDHGISTSFESEPECSNDETDSVASSS